MHRRALCTPGFYSARVKKGVLEGERKEEEGQRVSSPLFLSLDLHLQRYVCAVCSFQSLAAIGR